LWEFLNVVKVLCDDVVLNLIVRSLALHLHFSV